MSILTVRLWWGDKCLAESKEDLIGILRFAEFWELSEFNKVGFKVGEKAGSSVGEVWVGEGGDVGNGVTVGVCSSNGPGEGEMVTCSLLLVADGIAGEGETEVFFELFSDGEDVITEVGD